MLGTTDNQPLEVRVNGVRGWRLEPTTDTPNVIGGFPLNGVFLSTAVGASIGGGGAPQQSNLAASYATVGGGLGNYASGVFSVVGGGLENTANGFSAAVGGGESNSATGIYAAVGGGTRNTASADYSAVAGGADQVASGSYSSVAGGGRNEAAGLASAIDGGSDHRVSGDYSIAAGGLGNVVSGAVSFAAGSFARANAGHCVAFSLWGEDPGMQCFGVSNAFFVGGQNGAAFDYWVKRADGGGTRHVGIGRVPGQTISTWTGAFLGDNGVWTNVSDEAAKEAFADVDAATILDRVAALPVRSWRYKTDPEGVRRLGPTAQDFRAAFALGIR